MEAVLGFDTSCYTTSAALVDLGGQVLASHRMLLPVESGQRGLRQSEAVFIHVRQLPKVMDALQSYLIPPVKIVALAATSSPRQGEDSYMPVFTVGLGQAQVLSAALRVPCYRFSHQQGHIAAGQVEGQTMAGPFVALHLSGGTTEMLLCSNGVLTSLGGTLDLHAGQLIDRVGVALGLAFPAGPALEKLALRANNPPLSLLPANLEQADLCCHFSGGETRALRWIAAKTMLPEQIALEVFDWLARTVTRMLTAGCKAAGVSQALVVGGVASSTLLREMVTKRLSETDHSVTLTSGKPEYSADNAVGIAYLGAQQYAKDNTTP